MPHDFVYLHIFGLAADKVKNIVPTKNEKGLINLAGFFIFRSSNDDDQSEHLSNKFFCTHKTNHNVRSEESLTNVNLKKEIDDLKAHIDMKFNEILRVFTSLKNNLVVM